MQSSFLSEVCVCRVDFIWALEERHTGWAPLPDYQSAAGRRWLDGAEPRPCRAAARPTHYVAAEHNAVDICWCLHQDDRRRRSRRALIQAFEGLLRTSAFPSKPSSAAHCSWTLIYGLVNIMFAQLLIIYPVERLDGSWEMLIRTSLCLNLSRIGSWSAS